MSILRPCLRAAAFMAAGLLAAPPVAGAREQAPWLGTWQLNPAQSTRRAEPSPYKRMTTRIEPWEDGLKVSYDMVGTRGGVTHMEWTGRFDGRDYAVQGVDYVLTNAYRRLDERRYEIGIKVDGQPVAAATATVAPDGKTLTVVTMEKDAQGRTVMTTSVYDRR